MLSTQMHAQMRVAPASGSKFARGGFAVGPPRAALALRRARAVPQLSTRQGLLCAAALQAGGNGEARKTLITTAAVATDEVATEEEEYGEEYGEEEDDEDALITWDAQDESDELSVHNFNLSQRSLDALKARGIEKLFPIQAAVLKPAMEGRDIVGRARTGTGKTLAFALPMIEEIYNRREAGERPGRAPSCVILAPTRELAKQVEREIEATAPNLRVLEVRSWLLQDRLGDVSTAKCGKATGGGI